MKVSSCLNKLNFGGVTFDALMQFLFFCFSSGTLITLASALLFGFLAAVILFFLFFTFVMMAGYFGLVQIYELVDYPNRRSAFIQYLRGKNGTEAATTTAAEAAMKTTNRNTTTVNGNE